MDRQMSENQYLDEVYGDRLVKHIASGRIGKVVMVLPVAGGDMYELAFNGQLWTECYYETEICEVN